MNRNRKKNNVSHLLEAVLTSKNPYLVCLSQKKSFFCMGLAFKELIKHPEPCTYNYMNSSNEKLMSLTSQRPF